MDVDEPCPGISGDGKVVGSGTSRPYDNIQAEDCLQENGKNGNYYSYCEEEQLEYDIDSNLDESQGDLSELVGLLSEASKCSRASDASLYTPAITAVGWASRRKSHSVINNSRSIKKRNNPKRSEGSLTLRERDILNRPEGYNLSDAAAKQNGFERSYGQM